MQRPGSAVYRDGRTRTANELDMLGEMAADLSGTEAGEDELLYLLGQAQNTRSRFQDLLGKDRVPRDDYELVATELASILSELHGIESLLNGYPSLRELLSGRPLTTPGLRAPGEGEVRVSVILPVHDVEPYIGRCIESLRAQLLDGLEFVFVDDCSTDGSMAAVEAWAAEDGRVRILRNAENLGAGPSRNRGIEAARGDYLSFINPDDWVSPDFYELLYAAATAGGGHDIAKGLRKTTELDGHDVIGNSRDLNGRIAEAGRRGLPLFSAFTSEHQSALYRRDLVAKGARYGTSRKDQDTTFLLSVTLLTDDIVFEEGAVYHYVKRPGPVVTTISPGRYLGELDALAEKAALLAERADDRVARDYLKATAESRITSFYSGVTSDPSLAGSVDGYAQKLETIVAENAALRFLYTDCSQVRALCEKRALLPRVGCLPPELKSAGARDWIAFVRDNPHETPRYMGECAKAVASATKSLAGAQGKTALRVAYTQLTKARGVSRAEPRLALGYAARRCFGIPHSLQHALQRLVKG